jgi:hypothetical protein
MHYKHSLVHGSIRLATDVRLAADGTVTLAALNAVQDFLNIHGILPLGCHGHGPFG